ncbi:MAG: NAD+ synthase [Chloroflexi bacterium]|nr:NAD+ synthase [Chloroflexota bacterium]
MAIVEQIAQWLRAYVISAGARGFVIGLSGGVDSAVAAALAVRAVGADDVLGALMPCHSDPRDAVLGQHVADTFAIRAETIDLSDTFDALIAAMPPSDHRLAVANIKPRLRMTAQYYLAQTNNLLVLGSSNKSEIAVGYSTKYGDGAVDLLPLGDLYKTQVWELARELGVPREIVERTPTGGLWPGQTDEGEMGITYVELDRVLQAIELDDTHEIPAPLLQKVRGMIASSAHKRALPPIFAII